ncbi:hypothetical protein HanIR_Chr07g0308181 [Helianthus annuus]|nr:hypothetical protein HanIR_Chr07g0308181 [Helianthus annuus]
MGDISSNNMDTSVYGHQFQLPLVFNQLKSVLQISQVELNYLSMASDFGKLFGWCSGILLYFHVGVIVIMVALLGLFGYGLQWLLIQRLISLPYFMVSCLINLNCYCVI